MEANDKLIAVYWLDGADRDGWYGVRLKYKSGETYTYDVANYDEAGKLYDYHLNRLPASRHVELGQL